LGHACRDLGRVEEALREFGVGLAPFEQVDRYGEEPGLVFPIYVSRSAWRSSNVLLNFGSDRAVANLAAWSAVELIQIRSARA